MNVHTYIYKYIKCKINNLLNKLTQTYKCNPAYTLHTYEITTFNNAHNNIVKIILRPELVGIVCFQTLFITREAIKLCIVNAILTKGIYLYCYQALLLF